MLLEPVVVYYIIAEVGCQGGLLAMAAGKPREICEKLEPSCQKLKVPSGLPSSLKSLPPKCLSLAPEHGRLVTKHLTPELLRDTSQTASV